MESAVKEMHAFFNPNSVAIVGATRKIDKAGHVIFKNFAESKRRGVFKGELYPVNPHEDSVLGFECYATVDKVPGKLELVVIVIPAKHVPRVMEDAAAKQVKAVVIISSGFSEIGNTELEDRVKTTAQKADMRLLGPNCLGVYDSTTGVDMLFLPETRVLTTGDEVIATPRPMLGKIAVVTQSGAFGVAALDYLAGRQIGASKFVSFGNKIDVNEAEMLHYLLYDDDTQVILLYLEDIKSGRHFLKVAEKVTRKKPIVALKCGRTKAGARAAASHTGAIAGTEKTWDSLLKQAGAIRVHSLDELVDVALIFRFMSPPEGKNIAVIGFGGGTGVQAADACSNNGLNTPLLPPEIRQKLKAIWSTEAGSSFKNPVDLFGNVQKKGIEWSIKAIAEWKQVHLILIHVPVYINPDAGKRLLKSYTMSLLNLAPQIKKRTAVVLNAVFTEQSSTDMSEAWLTLSKAGFPLFPSVERAINAIGRFVQYHDNS